MWVETEDANMRNKLITAILIGIITACGAAAMAQAQTPEAISKAATASIGRLLPGRAADFTVEIIPKDNGLDVFEIEGAKGKIVLRGSSATSVLSGLNWYLKYYAKAHLSWTGDQLKLPAALPAPPQKVRIVSPYKYRYIYNYCTFNYTMSFWTWKEWERELDFIALNGVNLALASVVGQEALWQNFMLRLGFTNREAINFIPGPGYQAWWLMDNLEGWGGPVTQRWIDSRAALQKKILARMRELGIEPVMQGFYGMMPRVAFSRFPDAGIIETGVWGGGFNRPPMLLPDSKIFPDTARAWYEEQKKLYGDARFFGGDPFHEGEFAKVDLTAVGAGIQKNMLDFNPDAIWVLQGWQNNPSSLLLAGLKKPNVLILDLHCESNPQWRRRNGFDGIPWVWNIISNFGGKTGVHASMGRVASEPVEALKSYKDNLAGIGAIMEGSMSNDALWDLLFEMAWRTEKPELNQWLSDFAERRYGGTTPGVTRAWKLLGSSVYQTGGGYEQDPRSLFCERPSRTPRSSFPAYGFGPYDPCRLRTAWKLLLDDADKFKGVKTFEHDLVDVTREYISNANLIVHSRMIKAFDKKDKEAFDRYAGIFLEMIDDEDRLLATDPHFMLGPWIESARAWGGDDAEKKLFEWNARVLITTWGDRGAFRSLDDYASREWSGTLSVYYKMRWKTFIDDLRAQLDGALPSDINWYSLQEAWTLASDRYPTKTKGDPIAESRRIYDKYTAVLDAKCSK